MFGYFQEPVHHFCIFNIKRTNLRNLVIRAIYVTKFASLHPLCKSSACPANNRCRARSVRSRVANRAGLWRAARGTGRCIQRGEEQRNKRSTADEQVKKKKEKKKDCLAHCHEKNVNWSRNLPVRAASQLRPRRISISNNIAVLSVFPALPHPSTFWIPSTRVSSNASALASPFLPRFPPRSRDSLAGSSCRLQMASLFLNNSRYRPTRHLLSAGNRPRPKRMITLSGRWFFVEPRSIGAYLLAGRASLSNHVAARPWTIYTADRIPDYKRCVSW